MCVYIKYAISIYFFTGGEHKMTTCLIKKKPSVNKQHRMVIALILVTSVLSVVVVAYVLILWLEKYITKEVIV